jgi:hypothetical protein
MQQLVNMIHRSGAVLLLLLFAQVQFTNAQNISYPLVDTDVTNFYSASAIIESPANDDAFYGQDAHYTGNAPSYTDNGDGTIRDNVTGLMWEKDMGENEYTTVC